MKIHEYQAKILFRQYGIKTPEGILASSEEEAIKASEQTNFPCVIKAQVHSGARGKAGGHSRRERLSLRPAAGGKPVERKRKRYSGAGWGFLEAG